MSHSYKTSAIPTIVFAVLLALMPLSLVVTGSVMKSIVPIILFIAGACLLSISHKARTGLQSAWPLIGASCLMLLYVVVNVAAHSSDVSAMDGAAHILLYLVIAAVFTLRFNPRIVWIGFSLTAVLLGTLCIVQHFGWHDLRAHAPGRGVYTAIEYAMVLFGLALVSAIQLLRPHTSWIEKVIHGLGLTLGAYGALLTQSRGPILAFAAVFAGLLVFQTRRRWRWRQSLPWLAAVVFLAIIAGVSVRGILTHRFSMIVPQIMAYDSGRVDTSIGLRLEMWRTAARGFASHPWTGVGVGNFKAYKKSEIAAGRTKSVTAQFATPHNTYLKAAVEGGIPGIIVLLTLFGTALIFFGRRMSDPDPRISAPAVTGMAITILYMLCGITDSVFFFIMSLSFYFLVTLGTAVMISCHSRWPVTIAATAGSHRT